MYPFLPHTSSLMRARPLSRFPLPLGLRMSRSEEERQSLTLQAPIRNPTSFVEYVVHDPLSPIKANRAAVWFPRLPQPPIRLSRQVHRGGVRGRPQLPRCQYLIVVKGITSGAGQLKNSPLESSAPNVSRPFSDSS